MYIRKDVCTKDCTDKVRKEIIRSTGTLLPNTYEMRFSLERISWGPRKMDDGCPGVLTKFSLRPCQAAKGRVPSS